MSKAVLIFGANGQIGARLATSLTQAGYDVTALTREACDFATADAKAIDTAIRAVSPVLIINAAGYTAVDKAESQRDLALRINGEVPAMLARAAKAEGAKLIHFSTDYVFDGAQGRYKEDDVQRPLNTYGESKGKGEAAVLKEGGYIFRLQWIYDTRGNNFFLTMKKLLAEKNELRIVADQIGAPTPARDVAAAIAQAVPQILAGKLKPGAYHMASGGFTSWHGFACAIAKTLGSEARILPITSADYPLPATRPLDGRLDCRKLAAAGIALPHWRAGLAALLADSA